MNKNPNPNNLDYIDEEINFKEVFSALWKKRRFLAYFSSLIFLISLIYSLSLPNIYQSDALLSPVTDQGGISKSLRSYQGLASLAGIELSSQSDSSNTTKALEKLNSLSFFSKNILPNIYLPDLMALESWDPSNNKLIYNKNYFNDTTQEWIKNGKNKIPSAQESFIIFKKHLIISEDRDSGFITISVKHKSPFVAKDWTELLVKEINQFFRMKDKFNAQKAVIYLNSQMAQTNFFEVKQAIAEILQQKTQQLTLIEVNESYVFEYVDPPVVMEKNLEPNRIVIIFFGSLLGILMAIIIILFRNFILLSNS